MIPRNGPKNGGWQKSCVHGALDPVLSLKQSLNRRAIVEINPNKIKVDNRRTLFGPEAN